MKRFLNFPIQQKMLAMTLLSYASELRDPSSFAKDVDAAEGSSEENELAETLVKSATVKSLDLSKYKDVYTGKLTKLVEGKAKRVKRLKQQGETLILTTH